MEKKNSSLKDIFISALQNYKKKEFQLAESSCNKILNIDPNHFESIVLLANIAALHKDYLNAKKLLKKATEIQPNNLGILNNLGTASKELKEMKDAIFYFNKTLELDPNNTNAHYNLGLVSYEEKDFKKAKSYFKKTSELQPNFALPFFALGNINAEFKEYDNAIKNFAKAIEINPKLVSAHNNLGLVYRSVNDFKNAIICYENAIKIKNNNPGTYHNLALALKELGEFEKAIHAHENAIKFEPDNAIHYFYLSELKKDILDSGLRKKINGIIKEKKSNSRILAYSHYLLSRYEKKEKNYKKELVHLIEGHQKFFDSKSRKFNLGIKYCFEDVLQISNGARIESLSEKKDSKVKPIFIIGTPRSGSTLVEKIIGSGKLLIPMGEESQVLENFFTQKVIETQSLQLGNAEIIRQEINDIYKSKGLILEKFNYTFTDKSLNNFFYLELIKAIYPNAKIINCIRNPVASIMSIFKNNLSELAWAHDLKNIFKYFDNYYDIIENYNSIYPNSIYNLEYEKLVSKPELIAKNLMNFCELDWDKKCLEFHKRKDLILKTASNIQIRQAIFKNSIDKYKPYKKLLQDYGKNYSWFN